GAMFGRVWKAEFRSGLVQCSDCGIELVDAAARVEDRFAAIRAEAPAKYGELLAKTKDPRLYLGLLTSIANCRIPCYGKAVDHVALGPQFSDVTPEFEIWIPKENSRLATWVRDACTQDYAEGEALGLDDEQDALGTGIEETLSGPNKLCSLCSAEYTRETSVCENCGTSLYWSNECLSRDELGRSLFNEAQPQML